MTNPFEIIFQKLDALKSDIAELRAGSIKLEALPKQSELLTEEELLSLLKICRSTSIAYRKKGMPYIRLGGRIYYMKDDVFAWLGAKKFNH